MARSREKPPEKLSFRAYAKRRGVSHTAVAKAAAEGRITAGTDKATGRRWIDPKLADQQWKDATDEGKAKGGQAYRARGKGGNQKAAEVSTPPPAPAAPPAPPAPPAPGEPSASEAAPVDPNDPRSYAASNARHKFYQARLTELEFRKREAALVEAETVRKGAFELARLVREAILGIPDRIAAELASEVDVSRVHATLTRELRQAVEELTRNA